MNTFVALDFETANRHLSSVCSIGLVFVEGARIVDSCYRLIKPIPDFYDRFNMNIHGITPADTEAALPFPEVWKELYPRMDGLPVVAHNSSFDEACLQAVLSAYGLPGYPHRFLCTYRKSRKVFPGLPNHRLDTVARHVGFVLDRHHHALADAEACARIALRVFADPPAERYPDLFGE